MPDVKDAPDSLKKAKETFTTPAPQGNRAPAAAPASSPASPFGVLRRFAHEMDRLFEDFGLERGLHAPSFFGRTRDLLRREQGMLQADWAPHVDVFEKEGHLVVRADLPGVSKEDVKVEVTDEALTIHGERKQEHEEKREGYYCSERTHGSFFRSIPLPEGAEGAKATASFRNGVLEVSVPTPKSAQPKPRRVEIKE
ncbi:MAG: Hsp20/alpha crystallin family protein [Isosphaeraceae bacterium]|nr:Hsp20/alpha crystallin family protein [Isosphaeraceae bacterium]